MSQKKYKSIAETSALLGINKHVIRYWDSKFNGLSMRLDNSKQRFFSPENISKLKELKNILYKDGKHNYSLDLASRIADIKFIELKDGGSKNLTNNIKNENFLNIKLLSQISSNLKKLL